MEVTCSLHRSAVVISLQLLWVAPTLAHHPDTILVAETLVAVVSVAVISVADSKAEQSECSQN